MCQVKLEIKKIKIKNTCQYNLKKVMILDNKEINSQNIF